jgi:hypothetical protein
MLALPKFRDAGQSWQAFRLLPNFGKIFFTIENSSSFPCQSLAIPQVAKLVKKIVIDKLW